MFIYFNLDFRLSLGLVIKYAEAVTVNLTRFNPTMKTITITIIGRRQYHQFESPWVSLFLLVRLPSHNRHDFTRFATTVTGSTSISKRS